MGPTGWIVLGVIAALVIIIILWIISAQRSLAAMDENVNNAMSQIGVQLSSRWDALTALLDLTKGYAEHERGTLESVISARARATQITVDPDKLTGDAIAQFQSAQGELGNALGRLLMSVEAYPELKANENFKELQAQLEGTENRISTERMKYNETAQSYNTTIRSFPANILASIFGFEQKGYFKASEGADTAPKVEF